MSEGFEMGLSAKVRWLVALGLFSIGACNDVSTRSETEFFEMRVAAEQQFGDGVCGPPLEGVEVCVSYSGDCVLSGPNGEVTLELPVGEELYYTLHKDGYDSQVIPYVLPEGGSNTTGPWCLASVEVEAEYKEIIGVPYPRSGTGDVVIFMQPPKAGVTFDLKGAAGTTRWYALSPYEYPYVSLDLEATTETGWGGFFEVRPGEFRVELGGEAGRCIPTYGGWPDDAVNDEGVSSVRFPVLEDHYTILTVRCPVAP